jgi:hypothetical protein
MGNQGRTLFLLTLSAALGLTMVSCPSGADSLERPTRWIKGNTHTHSLWSDGDAAPEKIADWYKSNGYEFLVLSDHNILQEGEKWRKIGTAKFEANPDHVADLVRQYGESAVETRETNGVKEMKLKTLPELRHRFEDSRFIFILGAEISDGFLEKPQQGTPVTRPIHHISMNHVHLVPPPAGGSVRDILERTVVAVEEEAKKCGRPVLVHLNHPNFGWGVTPDDIAHVFGERFFEVYNGHRGVRNYGDKDHLSMEALWDYVLTLRLGKLGGPPLHAFAVDDAHHYHKEQEVANPGRGWIMVRCDTLNASAVTEALLRGDFYATSGVVLKDIRATRSSLRVIISAEEGVEYTTRFIGTREGGAPGEVLQESIGASASYRFKGDELYVRATIVSTKPHPNGYEKTDVQTAWIQPVVVKKR